MPESKQKNVIYKRAALLKDLGPATTLQSLLAAALKKIPAALTRVHNPADDKSEGHFINYHLNHSPTRSSSGLYGCEFIAFETGADQSTFNIDPKATEVDMDTVSAGVGKEFVASALYFGVFGNHVILCQSSGLRSQHLEKYINWLLITKAKVLDEDNFLALNDHIPQSKKALYVGVRSIELSAPLSIKPDLLSGSAAKAGADASKTIALKPFGPGWEAIKSFLGDKFAFPSDLGVENLADSPDIEVKLLMTWKGKRHEDDSDFLDGVASNLRHVDSELDYRIKGPSGELSRDGVKQSRLLTIKWGSKGRPDFDDIFPKMSDWLAILVAEGSVDA